MRILILWILLFSEIAMGQECATGVVSQTVTQLLGQYTQTWPWAAKLISFVVGLGTALIGLSLALRGFAEAMTRISGAITEAAGNSTLRAIVGRIFWLFGVGAGKVGYGTPTAVVAEQARRADGNTKTGDNA